MILRYLILILTGISCSFFYSLKAIDDVISSNPGAANITTGTGAFGEKLGFAKDSGVRLGFLLIEDLNYLFSGGVKPKNWSGNSLFILSLNLDTEKLHWWKGGKFGIEYLQFNGRPTNREAGTVQGYNSLTGLSPLDRSELYQLWYRHEFFNKKLIVRVGKQIPNYDFNNVIKPHQLENQNLTVTASTGLIYTPIYVNTTMLGVMPGYYNSIYGIVITYAPKKNFYINYGLYDGNLARGKQTGLRGPEFNSYRFQITEMGYAWNFKNFPGNFGIGAWNQSGKLSSRNQITEHGTEGMYLFCTQRLWWKHPEQDSSGVIGIIQAGFNDSKTLPTNQYAGLALTFIGLFPSRLDDSFGIGLAFSKLNRRLFNRKTELILQGYYQAPLFDNAYLTSAISYIPNPGASKNLKAAYAGTVRIIILF